MITQSIREQLSEIAASGWTWREIEQATGIDHTSLYRIASGERQPTGPQIDRLAAWLGWSAPTCRRLQRSR